MAKALDPDSAEAARFLDKIPFDPAVVREFVEARDSLR